MEKKIKTKQKGSKKFCLQSGCRQQPVNEGFCRKHYLLNWKQIKLKEQLQAEKALNHYVDRLVKKYPEDYLDKIKAGLENEEKFSETIKELSLENEDDKETTEREYLEKLARDFKLGG